MAEQGRSSSMHLPHFWLGHSRETGRHCIDWKYIFSEPFWYVACLLFIPAAVCAFFVLKLTSFPERLTHGTRVRGVHNPFDRHRRPAKARRKQLLCVRRVTHLRVKEIYIKDSNNQISQFIPCNGEICPTVVDKIWPIESMGSSSVIKST